MIRKVTRYRYNDREWSYEDLTRHLEDQVGSDVVDKIAATLSPGDKIAVSNAIIGNQFTLMRILKLLQELRIEAGE
jgi:hypothetical protein